MKSIINGMELPKDKDAFLVTTPTNIRYLTGFVGVDKRDAWLLLVDGKKYLFVGPLYLEQAKKLSNCQIIQSTNYPMEIKKLGMKKLEFEESDLTVAEFNKLSKELMGVTLVPTKNRIEKMRMIKREDEIENTRMAAVMTDQCFKHIITRIRPGVTEARLAWEIEGFLRYRGGDIAFAPIVAFNEASSQPHYHLRGNNPLRRSSLILLDFGAKINGYCADMTRVVFLDKPKEEWKRAYTIVSEAQKAALDKLSHILIYEKNEEVPGAELDRIARNVIKKSGFPVYPHSLGHSVGLDVHEAPRLTVKTDPSTRSDRSGLRPGMIVTIEPGIYVEGAYGIRIEDLVLLKEDGIEVLSKSKKNMIVL